MRLMRFDHGGSPHYAVVIGRAAVPFGLLSGVAPELLAAPLSDGPEGLAALQAAAEAVAQASRLDLEGLRLLAPVAPVGKVICIGLNYVEHAREGGNPIPDYPAVFLRCDTSLVAPGQDMLVPRASTKLDYEAELAVVIGRRAARVGEGEALDHVAGYTCFNDGSVRDYQRKSTQWTMGKNFDATGGLGPALVSADALPPGAHGLRVVSRLNGQIMQDGNTADMIFPVATLVSLISQVMTLEPGDVIATGTPSGVGYARRPPVFMKAGDACEVEIEGIGVLRNGVANAA